MSESSPFANLNPERCVLMRKEYDFSKGKRGPVVTEKGKTRITIFLDDEIIRRFRALAQKTGKGYQTLINQALKQQLAIEEPRLTATAVRKIIREELSQVQRFYPCARSPHPASILRRNLIPLQLPVGHLVRPGAQDFLIESDQKHTQSHADAMRRGPNESLDTLTQTMIKGVPGVASFPKARP